MKIKIASKAAASALAEHLAEKGKIVEIKPAGRTIELTVKEVGK